MITDDKILVLDYGSQYTQLIARNLREIGVYSEIWPWDFDRDANNVIDKKVAQLLIDFKPKAIILSGGPESVANNEAPKIPEYIFDLNIPILGVCYGLQALSAHFGGVVETSSMREYGHAEVVVKSSIDTNAHPFIPSDLVDNKFSVWMSHSDKVTKIPDCFDLLASTKNAENVIIAHKEKPIYGIQFHPEVTHTEFGKELLSNFALNIAGCKNEWRSDNIAQMEVDKIREQVGTDHVILGLSGGVDSSVAAVLLHKAIGDQLTCIFVDHGLLRFQEGDDVMNTFSEHLGVKVIRVNAKERFMSQLKGVSDPEAKRKIIGNEFVKVFEEESKKIDNAKWLAQGTIYPDVIESAGAKTGKAKVIKSHHNVGGLPEDMELKLVEPLRMLFKDEVRKIGVELGLAKSMVYRHPFPGPGLGVRILGEVKAEYAEILQKADAIFIEELRAHDLYDKVSQAFAVFLPVKSVGVVGDNRAYEYVVALRSVETIDFMTARWSRLPYDFLDLLSSRIINEISGISRVVYDISGKPPATIEWE